MCLIIDASCANLFDKPSPSIILVLQWISTVGRLYSGGKLSDELRKTKLSGLLTEWERKGALIVWPSDPLAAEVEIVKTLGVKSNDSHVIALARLSGGIVLITRDKLLMADFKNKLLVPGDRIVYPDRVNKDLRPHRKILQQATC